MKLKGQKAILILSPILVLVFFCGAVLASKSSRMLILPFNIYPEKDPSFLQKGIVGAQLASGKISPLFWKSRKFKTQIRGIAVGDVDGEGRNEIVFISGKRVFIYRYSGGSFEKVTEIKGKSFYNFTSVDIADIDRNGNSEIFVTNLPRNSNRLSSFVLEWNGTKFEKIADKANWYYRVLNVQKKGKILLGQKQGVEDIFRTGIYELKWSNGRYEPAERQILPKHMNVYGFAYGNVLNNEQQMIVKELYCLLGYKLSEVSYMIIEPHGEHSRILTLGIFCPLPRPVLSHFSNIEVTL